MCCALGPHTHARTRVACARTLERAVPCGWCMQRPIYTLHVCSHAINKLHWSADGRVLAVGDSSGAVHLLRVAPEVRHPSLPLLVHWPSSLPPCLPRSLPPLHPRSPALPPALTSHTDLLTHPYSCACTFLCCVLSLPHQRTFVVLPQGLTVRLDDSANLDDAIRKATLISAAAP